MRWIIVVAAALAFSWYTAPAEECMTDSECILLCPVSDSECDGGPQ